MVGVTREDDRGRDLSWSGWTVASDISPDGKWVVFDEQSEFAGENYTVALRNIAGSPPVKLGEGDIAHFSPDGKWVIAAIAGRRPAHFVLLPTGPGESKNVEVPDLDSLASVDFMPNGKVILMGAERGHGIRCYSRGIDGGPLKAITPEDTGQCHCSPDLRYFVARDHLGNLAVYPVDGGQAHSLPGSENMYPIRWADNHSILAFRRGELPGRVVQIDVADGKARLIRQLTPGDRAGVMQLLTVAATPDARTFAYSYQQVIYDLYVVDGLK